MTPVIRNIHRIPSGVNGEYPQMVLFEYDKQDEDFRMIIWD